MLLSYERKLLADFILASKSDREKTLYEALRDPKVSGPLLHAYGWATENT